MSTFPIRASYMSQVRTFPVQPFAGVISFFSAVLDVFADADDMARVACKRCPLGEE